MLHSKSSAVVVERGQMNRSGLLRHGSRTDLLMKFYNFFQGTTANVQDNFFEGRTYHWPWITAEVPPTKMCGTFYSCFRLLIIK